MKLVLLPGMDGSGQLFAPFLSVFSGFEYQVILLPQTGNQNYQYLAEYVTAQLPDEDFVLLAESFSGAIAMLVSQKRNRYLKAIIFVATFVTPPHKVLLTCASLFPVRLLLNLPFLPYVYRYMLLGKNSDNHLIQLFKDVIAKMPEKLFKRRIKAMRSLPFQPSIISQPITVPTLYLQPTLDRLVSKLHYLDFQKCCTHIKLAIIPGSHFIMQTNPDGCAHIISQFLLSVVTGEKHSK